MSLYYSMNLLKKKIWFLFYLIVFIGALLLSSAIYIKYQGLIKETQSEQLYVSKIFNNHLSSIFTQYETVLDLISDEFTLHNKINIATLDNAINKTPLLVGVAIFSPDGTVKTSTSNLTPVNYPNLLKNTHSRKWFKHALNSEQMVIGKPYFFNPINKWIIPIRKRIVDSKGNVAAVISTGVDLVTLSKQWNETEGLNNTLQTLLDDQFYRILRTGVSEDEYEKYYNNPVEASVLESLNSALENQQLTMEELRLSGAYIQMSTEISGQAKISTLSYNPKYHFWILAIQKQEQLCNELYNFSWLCFAFYLFLIMLFFVLFKWIIRIEYNKLSELTYKTEYDTLTGLYNRSVLKTLTQKLQKSGKTFSLFYIDLDHFKNINDTFGHSYGDIILIEASKRIISSLNFVQGTAIRFSGDEFVILVELSNLKVLKRYTQKLLADIAKPYLINNNSFKISASIGIAQYPKDTSDIETLLSYAGNSMSLAKKVKNQHLFFSQEMHNQLIKNIEIEQALHHAISNNEISLVYQPQLDQKQNLFGVEALVRWKSESLGIISPDIFIPIAEEIGIMPSLGSYIMDRAMSEISTLQKQQKIAFKLSINVSGRQFVQVDFLEKLIECYQVYQSEFLSITIEITESLFIESLETLLPIFHKMKAHNISLSLDDFGTGYSSLSLLRKIPIDELKIDKSFVDHITDNKTDKAMVKSIINMGKNLDMSVLAEGVETKAHVEILKSAGCDLFQGYYFSKPLQLAELQQFIQQTTRCG